MKDEASSRRVQKNKTNYISHQAFRDLKEALEGALAFERGERRDLNVTRIRIQRLPKAMSPKDIALMASTSNRTYKRQFSSPARLCAPTSIDLS